MSGALSQLPARNTAWQTADGKISPVWWNFLFRQWTKTGGGDSSTTFADLVQKSGDSMTGPLVLSGAPTLPLHAADKSYVDSVAGAVISGLTANKLTKATSASTIGNSNVMDDGAAVTVNTIPLVIGAATGSVADGEVNAAGNFYKNAVRINNTGAGGLTATGATQATALALTANFNHITGGAAATGVALFNATAGAFMIVENRSGNAQVVYPKNGTTDTIAGGASTAIANGQAITFWCSVAGDWRGIKATAI